MSRVGKLPVVVPKDMVVKIKDFDVSLKLGTLTRSYRLTNNSLEVSFDKEKSLLFLTDKSNGISKDASKHLGTDRSNLNNIVSGMASPFKEVLEINGVGYKAKVISNKLGNLLILSLGYSHDIVYKVPEFVKVESVKPNLLSFISHDKELLGKVTSQVMSFRKLEPYKGKGVKKQGQKVILKEGKKNK